MKKLIKPILYAVVLCFVSALAFAASQSTSGKTADDIITEVEQALNETVSTSGTTTFLNNAIVLDWIDAGVREIVAKTKCLQDTLWVFTKLTTTFE